MASGLDGVEVLTRQLRALGKLEDGKALRSAVREAIKPAQQMARAMAPVGQYPHFTYKGRLVAPGFTKRSVRVEVSVSRDKQAAFADLGVRKEAFYALQFVELGTSRFPAHPWLVPAFEATQTKQEQGIAKGLSKAVDKAAQTR